MADGKWISDLTASTPVADAARRVLTVRLGVVHDYLPLATKHADEDIENVHQLRVATRRAGAALEIFALCLSDKDYKTARKTLRRIRRGAGSARDWDVFLAGLAPSTEKPSRQLPGRDLVIGYALARRIVVQDGLTDASPNYPFDFERFLAETVAAVHKPHGTPQVQTLLDLAQPMLAKLLQVLHDAASGDLTDYDHLHQVRIAGKRLRYAMEVFVDCFEPAFKEQLYPAVEQMQEILGDANDSHVASQRLAEVIERLKVHRPRDWRRFKPSIDGLKRHHDHRVERQRQLFIDWWQKWQDSGGEAAFWKLLKPGQDRAANNGQQPKAIQSVPELTKAASETHE
jgi:CHAD domain-containing protein